VNHSEEVVLFGVDHAEVVVGTAVLHSCLLVAWSGMQVPKAEFQVELASVLVTVTVAVFG
jgi:hypothetical protein